MGKFVIKKVAGGVKFDLKVDDKILASSETYIKEDSCRKGIDSVKRNSTAAHLEDQTVDNFKTVTNPKFEVYVDKSGKYRFRLKARNGEIIAASPAYEDKASCMAAIESVRKNAPEAMVIQEK